MALKNYDLLLFGTGFLESNGDPSSIKKSDLADKIGISPSTLNRTIRRLSEDSLITNRKCKKGHLNFKLTNAGREMYEKIFPGMIDIYLTPDDNGVQGITAFSPLLEYINDPLTVIRIVSFIHKRIKVDVIELFQTDSALNDKLRYRSTVNEMLSVKEEGIELSAEKMMLAVTNLGLSPGGIEERINDPDRFRSALATAELNSRTGNIENALSIYSSILRSITGLDPNIWITALTRYLKCRIANGDHEFVLEISGRMDHIMKNPVHKAMNRHVRGDDLSFLGRYEEAEDLYRYCSGVYYKKKVPIMLTVLKNNQGVNFFRMGRFDLAEDMWKEAERIARNEGILWIQAIINMNLGDHYAFNLNQVRRGKDRVRKALKIMEQLKDLEGVADAHFNYSLVLVADGNRSLAGKYFKRSMEYPFHSDVIREERIRVFNERLEGMSD